MSLGMGCLGLDVVNISSSLMSVLLNFSCLLMLELYLFIFVLVFSCHVFQVKKVDYMKNYMKNMNYMIAYKRFFVTDYSYKMLD